MGADAPRRRRPAISLRALLLLVLLAGLLLGWRVRRARDQERVVQLLRTSGGTHHYDWEFVGGTFTPGREPPGPGWFRRLLGDAYFQEVSWVSLADHHPPERSEEAGRSLDRVLVGLRTLDRLRELSIGGRQLHDPHMARVRDLASLERLEVWGAANLTDAGIVHLRGLDRLRSIAINDCSLRDASLGHLAEIPSLEELDLRGNRITDAGLARLERLPRLRRLRLGYGRNEITDRGMESLLRVESLEALDLGATKVGDAGLRLLEGLPRLAELSTGRSRVTAEGIARFRGVRPGVRVIP